jgi:hypothetical protein
VWRLRSRIQGSGLTHEEVVRVWIWPANLEQLHQVVKLAVYVTTDSDWAFLRCGSEKCRWVKVPACLPLVVRLTLLAEPLSPVACMQLAFHTSSRAPAAVQPQLLSSYLLAQPLYIRLSQLLAGHEALNPAVECGDGRRFQRGGRQLVRLGDFGVYIHVVHVYAVHTRRWRRLWLSLSLLMGWTSKDVLLSQVRWRYDVQFRRVVDSLRREAAEGSKARATIAGKKD